MHAREWISPITCVYIIDQLVEIFNKKKTGCSLTTRDELILQVNWLIMPLTNPDGYDYTHTTDRLWRKNRKAPPEGK